MPRHRRPFSPPFSFPLQDLLEALGHLREEEGESGPEDESATGAEDGGSEWELPGPEGGPSGTLLPAEGWQSQWRSLLSSYRRRHFSGCFGTRMERIGAQTALGCNQYKARRSPRRKERGGGRSSALTAGAVAAGAAAERPLSPAESLGAAPRQLSALLSQVSGGEGEAETRAGSQALPESHYAGPAYRLPSEPMPRWGVGH